MIKPTANSIVNNEGLKTFSLRSGTRQAWLVSLLLFNIVLEVLARDTRQKRNKRYSDWKGRGKTILFAGYIILYVENPKACPRRKHTRANKEI